MTEFLFGSFPYAAVLLAVGAGIYRYFSDRFSYTSRSTQFLENRWLFWGSVPWHYGILIILLAHILAALFPGAWGFLIGTPTRLFLVEAAGFALGLIALFGAAALLARRLLRPRLLAITTAMDWILLLALLLQVASGVYIAWKYRWGSSWYLHTAVPWLGSLFRLRPEPVMSQRSLGREIPPGQRLRPGGPPPVHPSHAPVRDPRFVRMASLPALLLEPEGTAHRRRRRMKEERRVD